MARVGLISDTHGLLRPEALAFLKGCDHIVHGGDIGRAEVLSELSTLGPVSPQFGATTITAHGPSTWLKPSFSKSVGSSSTLYTISRNWTSSQSLLACRSLCPATHTSLWLSSATVCSTSIRVALGRPAFVFQSPLPSSQSLARPFRLDSSSWPHLMPPNPSLQPTCYDWLHPLRRRLSSNVIVRAEPSPLIGEQRSIYDRT